MDTDSARFVIVRDTFREYMQSCSEFWKAFQRSTIAIKSSERQRQVLQTHLGLQTLWLERQRLRFEYLLRGGTFGTGFWGELNSISQRLDNEWTDDDETGLKAIDASYRDLLVEIEDLVPKMNGAELDAPIKALQQNAQYREARELIADEVQRLNKRLSPA
ncbi:MAG TPA: hypothetical protein VGI65_18985 [Steroidobacteraceae bacterium]|jgi:exonuclease VII small subunit